MTTRKWRWIGELVTHAIHDRQIAEHGGLAGLRDAGALASALARPQNLVQYASPDAANLATAYAFGLAKSRAFADGNKRTAWVVARLFLADNGYRLTFDPLEAVKMMEGLAAGTVDEQAFARWLRAGAVRAQHRPNE